VLVVLCARVDLPGHAEWAWVACNAGLPGQGTLCHAHLSRRNAQYLNQMAPVDHLDHTQFRSTSLVGWEEWLTERVHVAAGARPDDAN
jgi:hypothetical protein